MRNHGRASASVRLEVETPFALREQVVAIPAATTRRISIAFLPEEEGKSVARLAVRAVDAVHFVAIEAEGVKPPICIPPSPCLVSVGKGLECAYEAAPDGTPCDPGACMEGGRCAAGKCVGRTIECPSDGLACTHDLCVEGDCVHLPDAALCDTADPCMVPRCDPVEGCSVEPAVDGSPCGPGDCRRRHVCMDGRCIERPAFEGESCSGPCGKGSCRAERCSTDDELDTIGAWDPGAGRSIADFLLTSGQMVLALDCATGTTQCAVAGLDLDARLIYRRSLGPELGEGGGPAMLYELDGSGDIRRGCRFPDVGPYPSILLRRERLYATNGERVLVFDLPGANEPERGWSTPKGNSAGSFRERAPGWFDPGPEE